MRKHGRLNIAMIGHGFMGRAHSNAFHQAGCFFEIPFELKLKTVCGRDRAKLQQMASDWGWEETAAEWEGVVNRADIDVVDICTPNYLHEPIAVAAARAGKMVLCEKPLARSVKEAEHMIEAARNVLTLVWFNYRRVPALAFARQLVEEGRLGQVYHYRAIYLQSWGRSPADPAAWRFNPDEAGSGALGDLLSHSFDLATWLNGPIRRLCSQVQTFAEGRRVDDAVTLLAEFNNGSMGTFEVSRFATGNQNRNGFEINGSHGLLEFNLEEMNHLYFSDLRDEPRVQGRRQILVTGPGHPYVDRFWPPGHIIGYEHTFIATLAYFLTAALRGERFHPNFADALEVQRLLEAVVESSQLQRWVGTDLRGPKGA
ncbi:MAG: Gfo/Idh/MocA family oxidoreductase [Terracidiphilus sp.]|jgi:predicted dehydrogenase